MKLDTVETIIGSFFKCRCPLIMMGPATQIVEHPDDESFPFHFKVVAAHNTDKFANIQLIQIDINRPVFTFTMHSKIVELETAYTYMKEYMGEPS